MTVRGRFDQLSEAQRAVLRAGVADHDIVSTGAFTEAGTLTYEPTLHGFTLRVQLRADGDDAAADVRERALAVARARVDELHVGRRDLRVHVQNMADVWR